MRRSLGFVRPEQTSDHERDETIRRRRLLAAQEQAVALFEAVAERNIIRPGAWDSEASDHVRDLAAEMFGVEKHWHKRIVRSGPHTMLPYPENPPDRQMTDDDIAFADFGPIFDGWEADFGRTWVLGTDPTKIRLRDDLAEVFTAGRRYYQDHPDITGEELYREVVRLSEGRGWEFGHRHCGHLIGEFPHERPPGDHTERDLMEGNRHRLRDLDGSGRRQHWILEIHLIDRSGGFGGFYEELLSIP